MFLSIVPLAAQQLPAGKGADLTKGKCLPCHGPEVILDSAGISRPMWVQVMADMEALGLEVSPDEHNTIVDYLATYLGPNPSPPEESGAKADTPQPLDAVQLYDRTCSVCHGKEGRGLKGQFPALADNPYVASDPLYDALVILYGLEGNIQVGKETFHGLMPGFPQLSDAQVAALANYILEAWNSGRTSPPITAEAVKRLREKALTPSEVLQKRPRLD